MQHVASIVALVLALSIPRLACAADRSLSLDEALTLARERAPAVLAAQARIDEARGRSRADATLLHSNPEIAAGVGRRRTEQGDFRDFELGVSQGFELGGGRGARVALGRSDILRAGAASEDVLRQTVRAVRVAFARGLHADERVHLARDTEALATRLLQTAEHRHTQGDVAVLDVNLARAALGRARAGLHAAAADRALAVGDLGALLDLATADSLRLTGTLREWPRADSPPLPVATQNRADLRVVEADIQAAQAEHRLGNALAWPGLSLGARFERDAGDDVLFGSASLAVPVFDRGQGLRSEAAARLRRLRLELAAAQHAAEIEVRAAMAACTERRRAVDALEREALPLLDENEALAHRSYEAGQIGLAEFLLVQHETLETRTTYLDRLLEAAIAGIELEAMAGVLR